MGLLSLYPQVATWASDNPQKQHGAPLPCAPNLQALVEEINDPRLQQDQTLSHPFTIRTIDQAAHRWPETELVFVVGSDLAALIPGWKSLAPVVEPLPAGDRPTPGLAPQRPGPRGSEAAGGLHRPARAAGARQRQLRPAPVSEATADPRSRLDAAAAAQSLRTVRKPQLMRLALAQLNPVVGDLRGNAERIFTAAREASAGGATLMLTPELSLWGYPPRDLLLQPARMALQSRVLDELVHQLDGLCSLLVGVALPCDDDRAPGLYNGIALVDQQVARRGPQAAAAQL